MKTLVVGASGATGSKLVAQLLAQKYKVKVIVRSLKKIPEFWKNSSDIEIIHANILELNDEKMSLIVADCSAIASCLGHTLSWKGIYGKPRRLVTDAVKKLCDAVKNNNPNQPVKFVLMNTTGNRNRDLNEPISIAQRLVISLLRLLLPPHVDNEKAADYLRTQIGQNDTYIEWTAVRPDGLINENEVTDYEIHPSPTRSAIFNAGKVSRINVAHFMASLINKNELWKKWKGKMPVIYSTSSLS
ncbi:NAD(P)-dependent oxidoreductase [Tenacibaculum haliotis]|uniref:NAD(P)-dependent oxidoreductase n=1 Tax=Tenacibaculum haliotis TaxID=1888914 RepID=UPI0021B08086|nr:NAD(P)-binding oxidoreductase [Tenacibaculum haliotis]MCT4700088.1 SDR family oxidoreductase [Tenacibaculum haliotis]